MGSLCEDGIVKLYSFWWFRSNDSDVIFSALTISWQSQNEMGIKISCLAALRQSHNIQA